MLWGHIGVGLGLGVFRTQLFLSCIVSCVSISEQGVWC